MSAHLHTLLTHQNDIHNYARYIKHMIHAHHTQYKRAKRLASIRAQRANRKSLTQKDEPLKVDQQSMGI